VLAEALAEGFDRLLFGGDLVLFGPEPAACVDRLRGLGEQLVAIKGNTDRYVIDGQDDVAHWTEALGDDRLAWLDALPAQLAVPEQDALLVHATPRGDEEMLMPETPVPEATAMLAGVGQHTLLCGHVHIQYRRPVAEHEVINPGSVGMPLDGDPRAAWAIVTHCRVELRRTAYEVEAVADRIEREDGPFADMVARRLRTARRD
jgi:diadenosine tetraphosphatase ApaH/serine/threonine PP2A family protein phosphatase